MQWRYWTFIVPTRANDFPPACLFHGVRGTAGTYAEQEDRERRLVRQAKLTRLGDQREVDIGPQTGTTV